MRSYQMSAYAAAIACGVVLIGIVFGYIGVCIVVAIIGFLIYRAFKK